MERDRGGQEIGKQQKDTCGLSPSSPDSDWEPWRTQHKEILSLFPAFGKSFFFLGGGSPVCIGTRPFAGSKFSSFWEYSQGVSLREAPGMYQNPLSLPAVEWGYWESPADREASLLPQWSLCVANGTKRVHRPNSHSCQWEVTAENRAVTWPG